MTVLGETQIKLSDELHDGILIRQEFVAEAGTLISVETKFGKRSQATGFIYIDVIDAVSRESVSCASVNIDRLEHDKLREFGIGANLVTGRRYELRIWTKNCRSGYGVMPAVGEKKRGGHLFLGSRLQRNSELAVKFNYDNPAHIARGTSKNLVSVVIPHWNCHDYLEMCLESIFSQTYRLFEVIVVDDASFDAEHAEAIVRKYEGNSIQFVQRTENGGAPAARNDGASRSSGEFMFFCDADVKLYPHALEKLVSNLEARPDADFAYCGFVWGNRKIDPRKFDEKKLRCDNYISTMSLLRSDKFPGFDEELKRFQDWDLWLTMVENGSIGVPCWEYLFEASERKGSISSGDDEEILDARRKVKQKHGIR